MRFEQPIAAITRRLAIAMFVEIEAVRSFASSVAYQAFCHLDSYLLRSMLWSTTHPPLPVGLIVITDNSVSRRNAWQHRQKPMLASCPRSWDSRACRS